MAKQLLARPPWRWLGAAGCVLVLQGMRLSGTRAGLAVLYHRIRDTPGDPDRELVPALGAALFRRQLRLMRLCFRTVPASALHDAVHRRRRGGRFPLAVTFDDDLTSHAAEALPILRGADTLATFFVCGASLQRPHVFWWELLQDAIDRNLLTDGMLGEGIVRRKRDGESAGLSNVGALAASIREAPPSDREALTERLRRLLPAQQRHPEMPADDIRRIVVQGMEIGFHTRRHEVLPALGDTELEEAMIEGRAELEALAGAPLRTIAYPHGAVDARVARAARAAGFATGYSTEPHAILADDEPMTLGRIEAPHDSAARLAFMLLRGLTRMWARASS